MSESVNIPISFEAEQQSVKELSKQVCQQLKLAHQDAMRSGVLAGFTGTQVKNAVQDLADDFSESLKQGQLKATQEIQKVRLESVSYTHLTLPTRTLV